LEGARAEAVGTSHHFQKFLGSKTFFQKGLGGVRGNALQ